MMSLFRKSLFQKITSLYLLGAIVSQWLMPARLFALTSGPSQPETQSFTPVGTTEMVDLSSGDFTYNIPLLSVEGYPINLSYQSGISMEDEATMVGLGWNLNIGQVNRSVRGLPDDFNGDLIEKKFNVNPDITLGVTSGVAAELAGVELAKLAEKLGKKFGIKASIGLNIGGTYNNYRGYGLELGLDPGITISRSVGSSMTGSLGLGGALTLSTMNGLSLDGDASVSLSIDKNEAYTEQQQGAGGFQKIISKDADVTQHSGKISAGLGGSYNTRGGLQQRTLQGSLSYTKSYYTIESKDNKTKKVFSSGTGWGSTATLTNFVAPVYTPGISLPFQSQSLAFSGTLGFEIPAWGNPSVSLRGYYSKQRLAYHEESVPAFGYLFLQNGQKDPHSLMDFSRENERPFIQSSTPLLALSYLTHDHLAISGHGVSGVYRAYRSDIGYVFDRKLENKNDNGKDVKESDSKSIGGEIGAGGLSKLGLNVSSISTQTESGPWEANNSWGSNYFFQGQHSALSSIQQSLYEPAYFKQVGELTGQSDEAFFDNIGGMKPVSIPFDKSAATHHAKANLSENKGRPPLYIAQKTLTSRNKRNQPLSYLNGFDASKVGLHTVIKSYPLNGSYNPSIGDINYEVIERVSNDRPGHHISEVTVLKNDGVRYVYGTPAMNRFKKEVTFSVAGLVPTCGNDQVVYEHGTDNSLQNKRGLDNYYDEVNTPKYAAAYLLTAVLSPDYTDKTGNGPSDDDYGTYYSIKYNRYHENYQWRSPIDEPEIINGVITYEPVASHNIGFKSRDGKNGDDKGSYVYGTRENWYVGYLESRNQIAVFTYSPRRDGLGVINEQGNINVDMTNTANKPLKLDKITLYSKKDWQEHGSAARKLKEIIFYYDYSLCPGVYNFAYSDTSTFNAQQGGKLTLKRIEMISENSGRARFSPYEFSYADPDHNPVTSNSEYNPSYKPNEVDRWGMYQPNTDCTLPNSEYPYTDQRAADSTAYADAEKAAKWRQRDVHAGAWLLNTIKTPGGGVIKVDYESDDYAYIQDEKAGQMYKLLGFSDVNNADLNALKQELYSLDSKLTLGKLKDNRYVYVKLDQAVSNEEEFVRRYIGKDKRRIQVDKNGNSVGYYQLFFNLSLDVDGKGNWDRVPAYVFVEDKFELQKSSTGSSNFDVVVIAVQKVAMKEKNEKFSISELTFASMNHARLNLPELIFDGSSSLQSSGKLKEQLSAMISFTQSQSILTVLKGIHKTLIHFRKCQKVRPDQSWVRLSNPDGFKHGGNSRVWRIRMDNNLSAMTGEPGEIWGTTYDYTTTNEDGEIISSGVASYEPLQGGDENSLKQPISYELERRLYPDDAFYIELPLGEYLYNASIIYSKIRVRNLQKQGVKQHQRAYTEHEYYTAKDYPVITEVTNLDDHYEKPGTLKQLLQQGKYLSTNSQGYVVRINTMHGAVKSVLSFVDGEQSPYAGFYNYYRDKEIPYRGIEKSNGGHRTKVRVLNNEDVPTITPAGHVEMRTLGQEIDFVVDSREHKSKTQGFSMSYNLDLALNGLPIPLLTFFGSVTNQEKRFRSLVTTKVISEVAILDSVINIQDGTRIKTAYAYYDSESGLPLVSSVTNEYKDSLFSTTQPAHWVYEGMDMAYKNQGMLLTGPSMLTGVNLSTLQSPESYFVKGDEVLLEKMDGTISLAWVLAVGSPGGVYLIDRQGALVDIATPFARVQTIRSGRKNQANLPISNITSQTKPIVNNELGYNNVLSASATEYSDIWQVLCPILVNQPGCDCQSPTPAAADFLNWLNELQTHQFYTGASFIYLNNIAAFTGSGLASEMGYLASSNIDWYWQTTPLSASSLTATILKDDGDCGLDTVCTLSLSIGSQAEFANVTNYNLIEAADPNCTTSNLFLIQATTAVGSNTATVTGSSTCFMVRDCETSPSALVACFEEGEVVNPYVTGLRGVWLPKKTYTYLTGRTLSTPAGNLQTNIRQDGTFTSFSPFWNYMAGNNIWSANSAGWVWTAEATSHLPFGIDVESRDVLNRYSAAQYGYNYQVPVAVVANSQYKDMGAANFEYAPDTYKDCGAHFSLVYPNGLPITLTDKESHTGLRSAMLTASNPKLILRTQVRPSICNALPETIPYTIDGCDCTSALAPAPGKYIVSFWVKSDEYNSSPNPVTGYPGITLEVLVDNQPLTLTSSIQQQLIDGWQRHEYIVEIPVGVQDLEVVIKRQGSGAGYLFFVDDFRFYGFLSSMKSYVYDPVNLRLLAELDANNYATFYQYDAAGNAVSYKRETQKGIQTLKEVRSNQYNAYE